MSKISGSNLFKNPAKWPLIPPWWLLSAPQAAALLGVTSASLHNWRVRSEGPEAVPPMYLRKTQGDPIYYMYGAVRLWAAHRVGLDYSMDDQCSDFFSHALPKMNGGIGSWQGRAKEFEIFFQRDHTQACKGEEPAYFSLEQVQQMDVYFSRQPRQLQPMLSLTR